MFFSQYSLIDNGDKYNELIITDEFKPDKWYSLSLRYKVTSDGPARRKRDVNNEKATATVFVNCKEIGVIDFQEGRFDKDFIPRGVAVLGGRDNKEGEEYRFPV